MHIRRLKSAFTLIELLIAIVIIGSLATVVVVNTVQTRAKARDASRRDSIEAYSTSLEQWRTVSPNRSYFVQTEGAPCVASNSNNTAHDPNKTGYGYMSGAGTTCVGFQGGGAGRMTRKNIPSLYPNASYSIVDALVQAGVLNAVRLDPRLEGKDFSYNDSWEDFILTTCNKDGYAASSPADAVNYTIYANLEIPSKTPEDEAAAAKKQCGGDDTGKGWQTVQ